MRNKVLDTLKLIVFLIAFYAFTQHYYTRNFYFKEDFELIIGEASNLPATWVGIKDVDKNIPCLLYTSPSPRDGLLSRMPSSA